MIPSGNETYPAQIDEIAYLHLQIEDMQKRLRELDVKPTKVRAPMIYRPPAVRRVIQEVAEAADVRFVQIVGESRVKHVMAARRAAICRLREMGYSAPQVGLWIGVHHSTVLYHEKQGRGR